MYHVELFELFGAAFVLTFCLMCLLWVIGTIKNNAGIVDIGWALSFFVIIVSFLVLGDGYWLKRSILTAMVSIWSLRLAFHLWTRFDFSVEDPRYTALKEHLEGDMPTLKMLMFFLCQGVLIVMLSLPFVIVSGYANSEFTIWEVIGILLWAFGLIGETKADQQLSAFKRDPVNKAQVFNRGFWKYSRHPNYFFEWVVWIGYFFFALSTPMGWLSIVSPLLMLLLLTRVSGIPLTESQAVKTKGDEYRKYQAATSPFIPLPPKSLKP